MKINWTLTLALSTFVLTSCTTMPISTMVKMSRFELEDIWRINPAIIRMRITSDNDDPLVLEKTKLNIQIRSPDGEQNKLGGALLVESNRDLSPGKGFFSFGFQAEHIYILKLDEEAIKSFGEMRVLMRKIREQKMQFEREGIKDIRKGSLTLGAAYDFKDRKEARLIVELLLDKNEDYFVLLNKVDFPPELNN